VIIENESDPDIRLLTTDDKVIVRSKSFLCVSPFFKAKLSDRWGGDGIRDVRIGSNLEVIKEVMFNFDNNHYLRVGFGSNALSNRSPFTETSLSY